MKKKNIFVYTITSYIWSYAFWLIAIFTAIDSGIELYLNENFVKALYSDLLLGKALTIALLAIIATWGPLVGSLVVSIIDTEFKQEFKSRIKLYKGLKQYLVIAVIFITTGLLPAVPMIFVDGFSNIPLHTFLLYFVTMFALQFVSSGLEEFGWRGFLLPEFLKENDVWNASFKTGIIWAVWHLPIVLYIFHLQGMTMMPMLFSFVGFSVGIVAMSVVHSYFFIKTKSVLFSLYIHAIGNTIPLIAGLLIVGAYKTAIVTQLLIWVVVHLLIKRNPQMFPKKEAVKN